MYRSLERLSRISDSYRMVELERELQNAPSMIEGYAEPVTYIYVFSKKFIRNAVLVDDIVVHAARGSGGAEEKTEEPGFSELN